MNEQGAVSVPISIVRFTVMDNPSCYQQYLSIRYRIFAEEEGWSLPHKRGDEPIPDPFDDESLFVMASKRDGIGIGILRGTELRKRVPYEDLIGKYLVNEHLKEFNGQIATLNSLAVHREYRRHSFQMLQDRRKESVSFFLLDEIIGWLCERGTRIIIASTGSISAARLLYQFGFYILDEPIPFRGPFKRVSNMGLILGDKVRYREVGSPLVKVESDRKVSDSERAVIKWFRQREVLVLKGRTFDEFVCKSLG
jgi:GNAT superfamily N-acetyltransferase